MDGIEVRIMSAREELERVVEYFLNADEPFLRGMGVDPSLLPNRDTWLARLEADLARDDRAKRTCYVGWIHNGVPIGHSSISDISFGEEAHIHLHMWRSDLRKAGLGTEFFKRSARTFMDRFKLKRLICEPFAGNPAPNRVLTKAGFRRTRTYRTVPGPIAFEQEVNRFELLAPIESAKP
jgi:[ribosomal protein S5]-alanine N-acetyltransferase